MYYGTIELVYAAEWALIDASCLLIRWEHFSAWNDVMAAILKLWRQIENPTHQLMHINWKNIPAKFHHDETTQP